MISKFKLADKKLLLVGIGYILVVATIFFIEVLNNDYKIVNHYTLPIFTGFFVFFILLIINQFLIRFSFYREIVNFKNHRFISFMIFFVYFLGFSISLFLPYDKLFYFEKVEEAFQYYYPGEVILKKYNNDLYKYIYFGDKDNTRLIAFINENDTYVEVDDYFDIKKINDDDLYFKYLDSIDKSIVLFSSNKYVKNDYIISDNRGSNFLYDCVMVKTRDRYYLYYAYVNGKIDDTYELAINHF